MGSFIRLRGSMAAVALGGAAFTAALPAAPAQATVGGLQPIIVPCSANALDTAISTANGLSSAVLLLGNCTFTISTPTTATDGLPVITGNITLVGGGNAVIRRSATASTAFRILEVATGATLSMRGISVMNGSTAGLGGGIENAGTLILKQVALSGNRAGNGGGLANAAGATANVSDSRFDSNTTTGVGGGAIINFGGLTLATSILSGNTAPINGGGLNTQSAGTSQILHSTIVHNVSGGLGGGMSNLGHTSLYGVMVQLNHGSSGGGIATGNTHVTLQFSFVRNNIPDNCSPLNTIPGCVN
jgi:hypothetical protein